MLSDRDSSYSRYAHTVAIAAIKAIVASRIFMVVLEQGRTEIHIYLRTLTRPHISVIIN